jgi:predicted RNase H-like nuclease (RuvC/YqgF family)
MVLNRIRELEQQKQQHQDKVNTLQSEVEIEELQDDMKKKEEHIARLEKKISEEKQEVEQIRDDLSADNNRIKELRRMVQSEEHSVSAGTGNPKKTVPKKQKSAASSTSEKKTKKEQELDLEPNSSEQGSDVQEAEVQDKQDETPDEKK